VIKILSKKSKLIFFISTAALLVSLLVIFSMSKANLVDLEKEKLTQQMDYFVAEIESYLQTGQIFIEGFSKNLVLSSDNESLFLQLKKFLMPFPFFSQLNIADSSGRIIIGFPQNKAGEQLPNRKKETEDHISSSEQISILTNVFPDNPSLMVFVINVGANNGGSPLFLQGESDLRANPLNAGLMTLSNQLIKKNVTIRILDSALNEIIAFNGDSSLQEAEKTSLTVFRNLAMTDWRIIFYYPDDFINQDAIFDSVPFVIIALFLYTFLIYKFVLYDGQTPQNKTSKKDVSPTESDWENRILNYKESLLRIRNMDEAARLILNYSELANVSSVRIVLTEVPFLEKSNKYIYFGQGVKSENYAYLDRQIIEQAKKNQIVNIPDLHRINQIHLEQGKEYPLAIFAYPIQMGNTHYGVLWLGFENPHQVSEQESAYIQELIKVGKNQLILLTNSGIYKSISRNLNVVLETFNSPVILLDRDDLILYSNNAAEKIIRNTKESPGEKIQDVVKDKSLLSVFQKELNFSDYEVTSFDGHSYQVQSSNLKSEENRLIKVYIFNDITLEKKTSSDLSEYSALLSHDLLSPMTIIKGYTTMLPIMGQLNDQQSDYVEKIISGVDEMIILTKNLLDYERLKMGVNLFKKETEIIGLLDKVIDSLSPFAVQKRIDLKCEYKANQAEKINIDSALIEQAIYNLIDNAIRFTPIQGMVTIGMGHVDNMVEISIEDTGVGIAEVDIPHIFDKFYRVKISPIFNQTGSGIGLALVKSIAEKHNGEVGAISNLGKGSTFYLRIPKY
jgi:signal transduction histidine kinase